MCRASKKSDKFIQLLEQEVCKLDGHSGQNVIFMLFKNAIVDLKEAGQFQMAHIYMFKQFAIVL